MRTLVVAICVLLTSCTSVVVRPVAGDAVLNRICIQENPRVQVADFVTIVRVDDLQCCRGSYCFCRRNVKSVRSQLTAKNENSFDF